MWLEALKRIPVIPMIPQLCDMGFVLAGPTSVLAPRPPMVHEKGTPTGWILDPQVVPLSGT
jgi:hypothetical protein